MIFALPCPLMSTQLSRGIDMIWTFEPFSGRCMTMIESDRRPCEELTSTSFIGSSEPSSRMFVPPSCLSPSGRCVPKTCSSVSWLALSLNDRPTFHR